MLFTYDVIWRENKELHWALRWDIYLSMVDAIPASVRWFDITKSLVAVILLAAILVWNLGRDFLRYNNILASGDGDFTGYNRLANGAETAEGLEEFGWKLVHADVFGPPSFSPLLLSVACGTGAQLLYMAVLVYVNHPSLYVVESDLGGPRQDVSCTPQCHVGVSREAWLDVQPSAAFPSRALQCA